MRRHQTIQLNNPSSYFNSDLITLDEPTTGLDPIALIHLKELNIEGKRKWESNFNFTKIRYFKLYWVIQKLKKKDF